MRNTRGSTFSLCRRASWDPALAKYPPLPVLACHGHAALPPAPEPASAPGGADG